MSSLSQTAPLSLLLERGAGYASALSLSEREGASLSTESDACIPKGGRGGMEKKILSLVKKYISIKHKLLLNIIIII